MRLSGRFGRNFKKGFQSSIFVKIVSKSQMFLQKSHNNAKNSFFQLFESLLDLRNIFFDVFIPNFRKMFAIFISITWSFNRFDERQNMMTPFWKAYVRYSRSMGRISRWYLILRRCSTMKRSWYLFFLAKIIQITLKKLKVKNLIIYFHLVKRLYIKCRVASTD